MLKKIMMSWTPTTTRNRTAWNSRTRNVENDDDHIIDDDDHRIVGNDENHAILEGDGERDEIPIAVSGGKSRFSVSK